MSSVRHHYPVPGKWRPTVVLAAVAALLVGCGQPADSHTLATPDPTLTPSASATPSASPSPAAPDPVTFVFQAPEQACPAVSALSSLPPVPDYSYDVVNSALVERDSHFYGVCTYRLVEIDSPDDDWVLTDHVVLGGNTFLYPDYPGAPGPDETYRELPVHSDDLDDWLPATMTDPERVWQEGCGRPMTRCPEGVEPTVRTRMVRTYLRGRVGNLEFNMRSAYIAERLPSDVVRRNTALLREFVLASIAYRETID